MQRGIQMDVFAESEILFTNASTLKKCWKFSHIQLNNIIH